ncbi:MAG: hypothetical protein WCS42_03695 [Verrucomicrobiota bacterium]
MNPKPAQPSPRRRARGFLEVDLLVGLAILSLAILPLGYSFARERKMLKIEYFRSVADEIVDGEIEILATGAAKDYPDGSQNYSVHANAAAALPPGHFQLTKNGNHLRLEWNSAEKHGIGAIVREVTVK